MHISSNNEIRQNGLLGNKDTSEELKKREDYSFQDALSKNSEKDNKSEDIKEEVEIKRSLEDLVADLFSLMKTGMTVDEKENLQELLKKIKEKIKEGNYSEEEIEKMLSQVENAIYILQKRITGEAIKEKENSDIKENISDESKDSNPITSDFLTRIDEAMKALEDLSSGKEKYEKLGTSPNESELLAMIKEFQK